MEHRNDGMNTLESLGREALYAVNMEHRNDGMNLDQSLNITVPRQKYVRNDEYAATIVARFIKEGNLSSRELADHASHVPNGMTLYQYVVCRKVKQQARRMATQR